MGANHVGEIFDASLSWEGPSHKLLAVTMAFYADRRGVVRLTQDELANATVLSRRRIATLIDDLQALGVVKRLGHGRYGLRFGLPKESDSNIVGQPKGSEEEQARLQVLIREREAQGDAGLGIAFRSDGWPVLTRPTLSEMS